MSKEIEAYVVETNGSYELKVEIMEQDRPHSRKIVTSQEFLDLSKRTQEGYGAMQRALRKLYIHDPVSEAVRSAYNAP